jgi:hypothetical protein
MDRHSRLDRGLHGPGRGVSVGRPSTGGPPNEELDVRHSSTNVTFESRMHVDLASREPDAEIERVPALGARLVDTRVDGAPTWREGNGTRWVVLEDPEGNVFCLG